jgi:hypothetical protein
MERRPPLYVAFTMDCHPVPRKAGAIGMPRTWELSSRSIENYVRQLRGAGFPATLFLDPWAAEEHAPLLEELRSEGAEFGCMVHPPNLLTVHRSRPLGAYAAHDQRALIEHATERIAAALRVRPRSFRGGWYSASDATYQVLHELGYRQGSLSRPGFDMPLHSARWLGRPLDAHLVDVVAPQRAAGDAFFELPLSCDPQRSAAERMPIDLTIDNGTFEALLEPVITRRLAAMAATTDFRTLCLTTASNVPFGARDDKHTRELDRVLDHLAALASSYAVTPVTVAAAHEHYRRRPAGVPAPPAVPIVS